MKDWHNLLQYQRNKIILDRAYEDDGLHVGKACREWVSGVLSDVSNSSVYLPQNDSNSTLEKQWFLRPRKIAINAAQFGEIVQMEVAFLKGVPGPHTAIVADVEEDGITFIENNWIPPFEETVNTRKIFFSKFAKQINEFTVYRIL